MLVNVPLIASVLVSTYVPGASTIVVSEASCWMALCSCGSVDGLASVAALLPVTVTVADVVVLPAASRATAVNEWLPFDVVVVSHANEYGLVVSSAPRLAPSNVNCTPATPRLSDAFADTVTLVETVAPLAGAVIDTLGGVGSAGIGERVSQIVRVYRSPAGALSLIVTPLPAAPGGLGIPWTPSVSPTRG